MICFTNVQISEHVFVSNQQNALAAFVTAYTHVIVGPHYSLTIAPHTLLPEEHGINWISLFHLFGIVQKIDLTTPESYQP